MPYLTYSAFHGKTGKGPEGYMRYMRYVANFLNHKGAAANKGIDASFAPVPFDTQRVRARNTAAAEINPLANAANAQSTADIRNAGDVFTRYGGAMAKLLAPMASRVAADYAGTGAQIAAANSALGNEDPAGQAALADYLSKAGGTTPDSGLTAARAAGVRGLGTDAVVANAYNSGAATNFARALPGLSALQGKEGLRDYALKREGDRNAQVTDLRGKQASLFGDLLTHSQDNELQKAVAKATFATNQGNTAENLTNDFLDYTAATQPKKPKPGSTTGGVNNSVYNKRLQTRKDTTKLAASTAANYYNFGSAVAPKGSPKAGTTGFDKHGNIVTKGGGGGKNIPTPADIAQRYRTAYLAIYSLVASSMPWVSKHEVEQLTRRSLATGGFPLFKTSNPAGPRVRRNNKAG